MLRQDFKTIYYIYTSLLIVVACVLWALALLNSPHLDGVSIYRTTTAMPTNDVANAFPEAKSGDRTRLTFYSEAMMMPYCVFPQIFNLLDGKPKESIASLLSTNMGLEDALAASNAWNRIDFDTWDNPFTIVGQPNVQYNMPYNLPYDGLDATKSLNPQYFSPICRCIYEVLDLYSKNKGTYDLAREGIRACMATRHIIQQQSIIGNDSPSNADLTTRKYISRHALVFNLCTAVAFTMVYNMIEFDTTETILAFYKKQWYTFALLFLCVAIPLVSQTFSAASVAGGNAMQFSSIVYLPAAAIFCFVEWMWSYVARSGDIRRQTYLHPYSFYMILVNLSTISLIENGVFTYEVLLTFVFLNNVIALAYTAVLFTAHGKLWQNGHRAELTGYILVLFLVGLSFIFHLIPVHPINSEINYLWILPMLFTFFCFAQIVVLEHLMDDNGKQTTDEPEAQSELIKSENKKTMQFTSSVHLLNVGHAAVVGLVILYYAAQIHYTWYGDMSFTHTGGKLDRRLNFELAELLDVPSYNNPAAAQGSYLRST